MQKYRTDNITENKNEKRRCINGINHHTLFNAFTAATFAQPTGSTIAAKYKIATNKKGEYRLIDMQGSTVIMYGKCNFSRIIQC